MAFGPEDMAVFWVVFIAYLVGLALIGVYSKKRTKSIQDFMVANRSIGAVLTGLSYGATYFSAVLFIGCPGLTWMLGSQWVLVTVMNMGFGTVGAFLILGNRTRRMAGHLGALTMPELLAKRYQDDKLIRPTTGIVLAVFQTIYLVSIFTGLALLLVILFPGIGQTAYIIAVILCGSITAIYLIIGGSHSAILSDLLESVLMLFGLLTLIIAGMVTAGGIVGLNANIAGDLAIAGPPFNTSPDAWFLFPNAVSMSFIGMGLVTTFGTWGSPQMSTRFFAAKSRRSVRYGMLIAALWVFVVSFCAWFAGYVGRGQFVGSTADLKTFAKENLLPWSIVDGSGVPTNWYEYAMPWLLTEGDVMPLWIAALFLAGTTAGSLTTGEKLILVASGSISRDFYQQGIAIKKNVSDEKTLKLTRICVVGIVVVAVILAINPPATILDLCMFSWASLNAFTLIPFIAGLYWKGGTRRAALISGLIALAVAVIWFVTFNPKWTTPGLPLVPKAAQQYIINTPWFKALPGDIHEFIVSQLVAIPSFFIISLIDRKGKPDREFLNKLFAHIKQDTDE
ncbi:MAG: hypothetical protein JW839_16085 [Candidatus Lokiarchaeota archaeon]|nr:hypothetical protein [Candidatus Lokiarchaeota archaeon]